MGSFSKRLLEKAGGNALLRIQASLSRKSPLKVEAFGTRLGRIFYTFGKRRRLRAISNLALAFPEMPEAERVELTKKVFEHFGRSSADFLASKNRTLEELEATTEVVGREHVEEALARGNGVLLVTGHLGNWERASAWLSMHGYKLTVVIRNADQEGVNQIVNQLRTSSGTKVVPRGNSSKPILSALRANEIVGIISDQNGEDAYVPFFGKMAGTSMGVGVIQERTKSAVLPVSCFYLGPGKYRITFYPLVEPLDGYDVKGEGLLRAINAWLEDRIREHPEQWLWFHDRWKNAREAGLL